MTQDITSLIEKLEGATEGSPELSADVAALIEGEGFKVAGTHVIGKGAFFYPPQVTTSLDAALALAERVLPRWGWDIGYPARLGEHGGRPWADCWPPVEDGEVAPFRLGGPRPTHRHVNAATMALAVCASLLRAQSEAR